MFPRVPYLFFRCLRAAAMNDAICARGWRRRENGNDFQFAVSGIPEIVELTRGDKYRLVLVSGLGSTIQDQLSLAIDNEQDFVGFLVFLLAKFSTWGDAHDRQFTEGSSIDCLAEDQVLVGELLDVIERKNHRICVPTLSRHGHHPISPDISRTQLAS